MNKHIFWPQAELVDPDSAPAQPRDSGRNYFECESHLLISKTGPCLPHRNCTALIGCCGPPVQALQLPDTVAPRPARGLVPQIPLRWLGSAPCLLISTPPALGQAPLTELFFPFRALLLHAPWSSALPSEAWGFSHQHGVFLTFLLTSTYLRQFYQFGQVKKIILLLSIKKKKSNRRKVIAIVSTYNFLLSHLLKTGVHEPSAGLLRVPQLGMAMPGRAMVSVGGWGPRQDRLDEQVEKEKAGKAQAWGRDT